MFFHDRYVSGLVSVIIPTYNRAWALRKTVASVFAQSYRPVECLVIDDGSTDETAQVMEELQKQAPAGIDLRYVKQDNGGANSARNHGLRFCSGEFICFLDSDDQLTPDSIQARAEVLLQDAEVDFCYGLCSVQDEQGKELRKMNSPWPKEGEARIAAYLFQTDAPLIRRRICENAGLWRGDDRYAAQEYEYFARIKYFSKKVVFIDRVVALYLKHTQGQIYSSTSENYNYSRFKLTLIVKGLVFFSHFDSKAERKALAAEFKEIGKLFAQSGKFAIASTAISESLLLQFQLKNFIYWLIFKTRQYVQSIFHSRL